MVRPRPGGGRGSKGAGGVDAVVHKDTQIMNHAGKEGWMSADGIIMHTNMA